MYYSDGNDGYSLKLRFYYVNGKDNNNKYSNLGQMLYQNIRDQSFKTYTLLNDFYELSIIESNELHVTLERINLKNIGFKYYSIFENQVPKFLSV